MSLKCLKCPWSQHKVNLIKKWHFLSSCRSQKDENVRFEIPDLNSLQNLRRSSIATAESIKRNVLLQSKPSSCKVMRGSPSPVQQKMSNSTLYQRVLLTFKSFCNYVKLELPRLSVISVMDGKLIQTLWWWWYCSCWTRLQFSVANNALQRLAPLKKMKNWFSNTELSFNKWSLQMMTNVAISTAEYICNNSVQTSTLSTANNLSCH